MQIKVKYIPVALIAIAIACTVFYSADWWQVVYPYAYQAYTAIPLMGLLYYAIKQKHPTYLKIIYIGLIDLNILNCMTEYFKIHNWMPYTVIVLSTTLTLVAYFLMRKRNGHNKHPTP